jgi:hypothetical protein
MRTLSVLSLSLAVCLSAAPAHAASHQLVLADPGYALWEIRPLDRRVYVLTLEGDWKTPVGPENIVGRLDRRKKGVGSNYSAQLQIPRRTRLGSSLPSARSGA